MKNTDRRGVALILVLILIVMISLGAYSFTDMMTAQERATVMAGRQVQAKAAVASGVEYIKDYLTLLPEDQVALGGHWDNPEVFRDIVVADALSGATRFSIVTMMQDQYGEPTEVRYGLEDQGAKLNVNQLVEWFKEGDSSNSADDASQDPGGAGDEGDDGSGDDGSGDDGSGDDGSGGGGPGDDAGLGSGGDADPGAGGDRGGGEGSMASGSSDNDLNEDGLTAEDRQRDVLMALPNMTEELADAILDWIDSDSQMRVFGVEDEAYVGLGYAPANGPISSLDELLLVQGMTPELLYGADRNHNGMLDENELSAASALGGATGSMSRGWSAYLSTASKDEIYQAPDVEPIDLNQDDMQTLYDEIIAAGFDDDFATYVVVYRQSGPYAEPDIENVSEEELAQLPVPEPIEGRQADLSQGGQHEVSSILDLIGSSAQGQFLPSQGDEKETVLVSSPFGADSDLSTVLPELFTNFSAGEPSGTGRVNTNQCNLGILSALPGIDDATAQNIAVGQDPAEMSGDVNYLYPTWPLAMGAVTIDQMKAMLPYVSGTGKVFRAQVIGYSDVPGTVARAEVIFDASGDTPKVLSWRDVTHLGPGFPIDTLTQQ